MVSLKIKSRKKKIISSAREEQKLPEADFSKSWAIWLDDERPVPQKAATQYLLAKNLSEFINLISNHGIPSFISFDWYLGSGRDNGEAAIQWLIEADQSGKHHFPRDFLFDMHSSDHDKNRTMRSMLLNYLMSKGDMEFFYLGRPCNLNCRKLLKSFGLHRKQSSHTQSPTLTEGRRGQHI